MMIIKPLFYGIFSIVFGTVCSSISRVGSMEQLSQSFGNCSVSYDNLPDFCQQYYTNASFWLGTSNDTLRNGLESVKINVLTNVSDEQFLDMIERHLCYYYYPLCDPQTGDIKALCSGSCNKLNDNQDYSTLLSEVANEIVSRGIEPPDDKCLKTFHDESENTSISSFCIRTEDATNAVQDSIGLSCIPVPRERDMCSEVLSEPYYAPNVTEIVSELFVSIVTIIQGLQDSGSCGSFASVLLCAYTFPGCDFESSQLLPICPDKCTEINARFESCRAILNDEILDLIPNLRVLLENFDCFNTSTYFSVPPQFISDESCSNLTNETFITMPEDSEPPVKVIVGVSVGGVALVIIVILLAIIIMNRKKITSQRSSCKEKQCEMMGSCSDASQSLNGSHQSKAEKMSSTEVDELLNYVKMTFADILISMEFIVKQDFIGKGAFGVVHKGELIETDGSAMQIAIKTIQSTSLNSVKDLVAETAVMKKFSHPNVLQLLGVSVDSSDDDMFKVILPYMPNGDLRSFLKKNRVEPTNIRDFPNNIDKFGLIRMCIDIAKGMEYLSAKRFVHRDLAARNCMVDMNLNIRVADFGLTRDIYSIEYYRIEKHTTLPVKWMALESLLDGYFDEKTDVWSYGVTCWEIFSLGRIPYPGVDNANIITILKHGKRLDKPVLCPQKLYKLLQMTWQENFPERPSFAAIVNALINGTLI